jgi:hypothetical protein
VLTFLVCVVIGLLFGVLYTLGLVLREQANLSRQIVMAELALKCQIKTLDADDSPDGVGKSLKTNFGRRLLHQRLALRLKGKPH